MYYHEIYERSRSVAFLTSVARRGKAREKQMGREEHARGGKKGKGRERKGGDSRRRGVKEDTRGEGRGEERRKVAEARIVMSSWG